MLFSANFISIKNQFTKRKILSAVLFFLVLSTIFSIQPSYAEDNFPPLDMPRYITFCGEKIDTKKWDIRERIEVRYYAYMRDKAQMILWMKRTKRYFPIIEDAFAAENLPDDLKYIAVVESSLIPRSYSNKGAVGMWQFVRDTGRKYGLVVKKYYDERRDEQKASYAAAKYLSFLHDKFGNWPLAIASYNIGENRIVTEMKEQETSDFFAMMLPRETDEYVINVIVVKYIMEHPLRYGLTLEDHEYFKPHDYKEIKLTVTSDKMPVSVIAQSSLSTVREIKILNPQIIGNYIYKGNYNIRISAFGNDGFFERYANNYGEFLNRDKYVKVVKEKAILRTGPGTDFDLAQVVKQGTKLKYISSSEKLHSMRPWYKVEGEDSDYWVWSGLVSFVD